MENFQVTILGCGSATPTVQHNPSAQVINVRDKLFMIDCGEGTQQQLRRYKFHFGHINRIFISHLHGDHCFGLVGLISTLSMLGRVGTLYIHAVPELEDILRPELNFFCKENTFNVEIVPFDSTVSRVIYEDRSIEVITIPLIHRIPCAGFLFREKQREAHFLSEMGTFYNIPIKEIPRIKNGEDYVTSDGIIIPNNRLTKAAPLSRSYAYCSDTAYNEKIIPIIKNVDLLYHESTFLEENLSRAIKTCHSTAQQAATIAKKAGVKNLMIGHFSARHTNNNLFLEEAQSIFPNTILAKEGLSFQI